MSQGNKEPTSASTKKPRGFALLSAEQRTAISKKGGIAAHSAGTAHEFTREEARVAGRKGGNATRVKAVRSGKKPSPPPAKPFETLNPEVDSALEEHHEDDEVYNFSDIDPHYGHYDEEGNDTHCAMSSDDEGHREDDVMSHVYVDRNGNT